MRIPAPAEKRSTGRLKGKLALNSQCHRASRTKNRNGHENDIGVSWGAKIQTISRFSTERAFFLNYILAF